MPSDGFGERLKQTRMEAGYTQKELADKLGLQSDSYITNVEKGRKSPNHRLLTEIVTVLGCSADYLLFGTQGYNERRLS